MQAQIASSLVDICVKVVGINHRRRWSHVFMAAKLTLLCWSCDVVLARSGTLANLLLSRRVASRSTCIRAFRVVSGAGQWYPLGC